MISLDRLVMTNMKLISYCARDLGDHGIKDLLDELNGVNGNGKHRFEKRM